MVFSLRVATIDDVPDILAIYRQGDDFALSGDRNKDINLIDVMEWVESATPERPMFVVSAGGEVIGWGALEPFYGLPSFDMAAEVSVYLLPQWRGKGAAAAFIQYLADHKDALHFSHLVAYIYARNTLSLRFFKKQGFESWGVLPKIASCQELQEDVFLLGRVFC
ncbi:Putative phosphinothricin acetyltransferase YwnH [Marinomonas spartinae]|uniref:Putative phosphinothricin acetyltransferase YwnH n=1 Tax=Marinomonas spartinae TaxID=1792290 RepID=A0A1A8TDH2_9GAMM|nr:GNAT family N-acetyltransferase [Marinomonas spartinae]SBS30874.1 Putative phosphinothricin acetyltransferase YwnH [Marinomonas spartinae]